MPLRKYLNFRREEVENGEDKNIVHKKIKFLPFVTVGRQYA
jgi:hypothetical protein